MLTIRIPSIPPPAPAPAAPEPELTPEPRSSLSTPRFARGLSVLSVSWSPGRLEAVGVHKGRITGTWVYPGNPTEPGQLGALLKEAVVKTEFPGSAVSLVLAHHRLTHQLLETPPAKGAALTTWIRRQLPRLKVFDGDAAWSFQPALPTKSSQCVLVHLFPQGLLDELTQGATQAGLRLIGAVPTTPILLEQIARLPLKPDDVALIVAEIGGMMTVVVGRTDGQLLLSRSLEGGRGGAEDSLGVDLNRTLLYVSQRFGVSVSNVWLFGETLAARRTELQAEIQGVTVLSSPEETRPCYWAEEAARLSPGEVPNLLSLEQRQAPQRKIFFRMSALLAVLLVLAVAAWMATCEVLIHRERLNVRDLRTRASELQDLHQRLQRTYADLDRKAQLAKAVLDDRSAPVPAWFLAYVAGAVPPELLLTNLVVKHHNAHWDLSVSGVLQPMTNGSPTLAMSNGVVLLGQRLRTGPFHVNPGGRGPRPDSGSASTGGPSLSALGSFVARVRSASPPSSEPPIDHFALEGQIQ